MRLSHVLDRMTIGDAAQNGAVRVDYLHPDPTVEPCYAVMVGSHILFMNGVSNISTFARRNAQQQAALILFLDTCNWQDQGVAPPTGDDWHLQDGGSEFNPLWETGIGALVIPDGEWFFSPSPFTLTLRSAALLYERHIMTVMRDDNGIAAIDVRPGTLTKGALRPFPQRIMRDGLYRIHSRNRRNLGAAQLQMIHEIDAAAVPSLLPIMGYSSTDSIPLAHKDDRLAYVLQFCAVNMTT